MTPHILLINPNSSQATSDMMHAIAHRSAAGRVEVETVTASRSPGMIVTPEQLAASAPQVVELGAAHGGHCAGIIVSAFGDPGLADLRRKVAVPVVGICEASMIEASQGGRRFAVATSTPDLVEAIGQRAHDLGLAHLYTGIRCTQGDPVALAADPALLIEALAGAVRQCIELDGAEAVIIGGGPLGEAAEQLRLIFDTPVLGPIPCAVERIIGLIGQTSAVSEAV
ncbi:aspartate/glutamate racemase family protein [Shinella zoogloeoides]|jgi:allantoin racemase|uniref:aspartate/glutamate racemase family protein n=1 Tax=Shinella zoogloeoides TaxID=352475 RepID=UPI00273D8FF3|nr:aspartate/glutamate racemase family protein [Shinella zoogloeoides]WLR92001.1 aspartate/glutamate racemase family protein [Shinella zoogloeoides]